MFWLHLLGVLIVVHLFGVAAPNAGKHAAFFPQESDSIKEFKGEKVPDVYPSDECTCCSASADSKCLSSSESPVLQVFLNVLQVKNRF